MANLLESTETDFPYPDSNDLGIREGERDPPSAREDTENTAGRGRLGLAREQGRRPLRSAARPVPVLSAGTVSAAAGSWWPHSGHYSKLSGLPKRHLWKIPSP